jgi:hypothetical protein
LHGQWYNRPTRPLKSKVWLYCIKSCHVARRRTGPIWQPYFRLQPSRNLFSPVLGKDSVFIGLDSNNP